MTTQTISEKILSAHCGHPVRAGEIAVNARRRQQAERHAHPTVRVLAAAATSIASC